MQARLKGLSLSNDKFYSVKLQNYQIKVMSAIEKGTTFGRGKVQEKKPDNKIYGAEATGLTFEKLCESIKILESQSLGRQSLSEYQKEQSEKRAKALSEATKHIYSRRTCYLRDCALRSKAWRFAYLQDKLTAKAEPAPRKAYPY